MNFAIFYFSHRYHDNLKVNCQTDLVDWHLHSKLFQDHKIIFFSTEGPIASSAMGKSIVILNKEGGEERFACANIEPDKDIIKYANIKRNPRFDV